MPPVAPTDRPTVPRFLDALGRSGLVPPGRGDPFRDEPDATALADRLVASGELTRFQADKLLRGQWLGLVLGPYRILSPLGRGGMGIVYLARDASPAADRPLLAVKILPPAKAVREPRTRGRFLREMAFGQVVPPHPHIARVFDAGEIGGVLFIAMEYVPGWTVRAAVAADGPMAVGDAARAFAQAADGLAAAHDAGLIHRDLKPANVMVTPDGAAKLLDFGLALRVGEPPDSDPRVVGGPGYAVGTMDFIAPEQTADATAVTPRSDLYALGCSVYYALAGCPPFPGGTTAQKLRWHRTEVPPPVRTIRPDLPPGLAAVIERLMAKDPADRYDSARQAADALRRWSAEPVRAVPAIKVEENSAPDLELEPEENELWAEEVIEAEAGEETDDEPEPEWDQLPVWAWAALTAAVLLLAMAAGFAVRVAVG